MRGSGKVVMPASIQSTDPKTDMDECVMVIGWMEILPKEE